MKITVVGTGAMGSVYAARFATGGHQVLAIDPWQEHVDAINSAGLKIQAAPNERASVRGVIIPCTSESVLTSLDVIQ